MSILFRSYIWLVLLVSSSASWAPLTRQLHQSIRSPRMSLQKVTILRGGASDASSSSSSASSYLSSTSTDGGDGVDVSMDVGGSEETNEEMEQMVVPPTEVVEPSSLSTDDGDDRGKAFFKMGPKAKSPAGFLRSALPSLPWYAMPDYLTYMRCVAVPLLPVLYYYDSKAWHTSLLFGVASFTDWLDGFLARRWDISTNFGAFLDPVADKLAVSTGLILLAGNNDKILTLCTAIILAREIAVSALREWMAQRGLRETVKVGWQGKCKTAFTMMALTALLALPKQFAYNSPWSIIQKAGMGLLYASTLLTVTSGAIYFRAAAPVLMDRQ